MDDIAHVWLVYFSLAQGYMNFLPLRYRVAQSATVTQLLVKPSKYFLKVFKFSVETVVYKLSPKERTCEPPGTVAWSAT